MQPHIRVKWTAPADYAYGDHYEISAKRMADQWSGSVNLNATSDYIEDNNNVQTFEALGYRVGDLIQIHAQGGGAPADNDGVYQITSFDNSNYRAYVSPGITTTRSAITTYTNPASTYISRGVVLARRAPTAAVTPIEDFLLGPVEYGQEDQRWRVKLTLRNVLGMSSGPAHNLVGESDNFDNWGKVNSPVVTTGQSDPLGGTDACLINDDSGSLIEYVLWSNTSTRTLQFDTTSRKRFGVWIKAGTATDSLIKIYDNATVPQPNVEFDISWSGGVPTIIKTENSGMTAEVIYLRNDGSGWYWFEFMCAGIIIQSDLEFRIYPAGDTAADTGTMYAFRACAIDDDRDITPLPTTGAATPDVGVDVAPADISSADSPYSVGRSDNLVSINLDASMTITLPKALEFPGRVIAIKIHTNASSAAALTISAATGDTSEVTSLGSGDTSVHQRLIQSDPANNYWRVIAT
jgi:hypothetical protein